MNEEKQLKLSRFPKVTPEVDTIRFYFHLWQYIDLDLFFARECKRGVVMFQREVGPDGEYLKDQFGNPVMTPIWEKYRCDNAPSWFQKMQITMEHQKSGDTGRPVLSVEYSVAKWYNISNGVNRGVAPSKLDCIKPVWEVLKEMHIMDYTTYDEKQFLNVLLNVCQVRRLDISYNFKCNQPVERILLELQVCRLNNKAGDAIANNAENGTVSWGGGRGSLYKAMFYNKEKEQKEFFHKFNDNTIDTQRNKLTFYDKNKDKFENVIRFEVQYRSKFFLQHLGAEYKDKHTMETFDKIIDLCQDNWQKLLREFDAQSGLVNVRPEPQYKHYEDCMKSLEFALAMGEISFTKMANLKTFVERCFKFGWESQWRFFGKTNFGFKYREIKKICKFDIKAGCVATLPIMRIMEREGQIYNFALKWHCESSYTGKLVSYG